MQKIRDSVKSKVSSLSSLASRIRRNTSAQNGQLNFGYNPSDTTDGVLQLSVPALRQISVSEPSPNIDYYRNPMSVKRINRPSLNELHQERFSKSDGSTERDRDDVEGGEAKKAAPTGGAVKFGWIVGVFVRCVLNILGAMLYLRISWVSGQAGIGLASVIILLSALVTTLTALSMCAICTNGEIKGGGSYYMLSRALGPEFGGSMGLIFALANALAVGMHIVGFAETVRDIIVEQGAVIVDGSFNDLRIIGVCTLVLCFCIVLMGVDFEVKAQLVLLVVLVISYINYFVGTFIPFPQWKQARGLVGYNWKTFSENFVPQFRGEGFFTVFAVFFPAATGIMAGANISGDLKDPGSAIPKGTLLAILVTTITYLGAAWMSASSAVRDASGSLEDLLNGTLSNCRYNGTGTCKYGIMNFFQTMEMQSGFGPLVTAGIFAATLSSALACLVSGPKLVQAVGRDKLFPKFDWLAVGFGKQDEPRRAYVLCFFISLGMVMIADLNVIASYISNFYLATYGLINYACFDGSIAKSPGWRPSFKYYNKWSALLGAVLCIACMFLMSWIAALLTCAFIVALYIYLLRKQPDVNWGSSTQAHSYRVALKGALKLLYTEDHVKNFRPQIVALTGNPMTRPAMVDFVKCITGRTCLLMFGHIVTSRPDREYYRIIKLWATEVYLWLRRRKAKGFYIPVAMRTMKEGVQSLLQASGVGKLKPNVVIMGFKNDWNSSTSQEIDDYFQMLHAAFECGVGVGVLRVAHGLDYSNYMVENIIEEEPPKQQPTIIRPRINPIGGSAPNVSSSFETSLSSVNEEEDIYFSSPADGHQTPNKLSVSDFDGYKISKSASGVDNYRPQPQNLVQFRSRRQSSIAPEILLRINQFRPRVKKPVIDIWWLYDDGGLTLLIPYLLTHHRSYLANAKLRVFTAASSAATADQDQKNLNALLEKFRIKASDIKVIKDLNKVPQLSTVNEFDRLISPFKMGSSETKPTTDSRVLITENELSSMKERTNIHLRTRELLVEHSRNASLVVLTLPVPRKGAVSACLYLAWLDMLSKDFSPLLFIRGNQQSVLTFYS